jgi:tRNA-modifying protein YgfZ
MQNHVSNDFNFSVCLNAPGAADGLALISARGADAGSFLQGQLTNDVLLMKETEARLAAWCSAKGRMLSSFIVWKNSPEEFYLLMSADLLTVTLKRLKMFVLRAKCVLTDETANFQVMGLVGEQAVTMNLGALRADSMPASSPKSLEKAILLPPGWHAQQAVPRALHIMPANTPVLPDAILFARWNYLEVTSGIARITAPIHEAFVPQMLNYESVGGVNFKKGCYPGQEVVARSQFRGTLKRRAYLMRSEAALQAGQEVFDAPDAQQPCGTVAQAASDPQGGWLAIVSMQTGAAGSANLHAGSADGAKLQLLSLPYALLDDV